MPPDRTTTPPEGRSRTAADQQNRSTAALTGRATIPRACEAASDADADFCLAFSVWLIAGGERWRGTRRGGESAAHPRAAPAVMWCIMRLS
jgi:hypothetical protein